MKTLLVILIVLSFSFGSRGQGITQLEETRIEFSPIVLAETNSPDEYRYKVNDGHAKEFIKNPIGFMETYFDIQSFIKEVANKNYNSYLVLFSTDKGSLEADYNKNGELIRTKQRFTDIHMPQKVRNELFRQTKGWSMVKNSYKAFGTGSLIDKELYRIKVVNGNKSKIIKIDPKKINEDRFAGI